MEGGAMRRLRDAGGRNLVQRHTQGFRAGTEAGDHKEKCCLHEPTEPIQEGSGFQG